MFYSLEFLTNASTTVFAVARFNKSAKYMFTVEKELLQPFTK